MKRISRYNVASLLYSLLTATVETTWHLEYPCKLCLFVYILKDNYQVFAIKNKRVLGTLSHYNFSLQLIEAKTHKLQYHKSKC